jgi:hypothetical protein
MAKLLIWILAGWMVAGQTPAEMYLVEEYREWEARQRPGGELLERYRAYLIERGADTVDAETTIRVIRRLEGGPDSFLVEMAGGRKPGKALEVARGGGRSGAWLRRQGWEVTEVDVRKPNATPFQEGRWDLIVIETEGYAEHVAAIGASLRAGGRVIVRRGGVMPGLRLVGEGGGRACWERVK